MIFLEDEEGATWEFQTLQEFKEKSLKHNIDLEKSMIRCRVKLRGSSFLGLEAWLNTSGGKIL